jgi:hypothetical protein
MQIILSVIMTKTKTEKKKIEIYSVPKPLK